MSPPFLQTYNSYGWTLIFLWKQTHIHSPKAESVLYKFDYSLEACHHSYEYNFSAKVIKAWRMMVHVSSVTRSVSNEHTLVCAVWLVDGHTFVTCAIWQCSQVLCIWCEIHAKTREKHFAYLSYFVNKNQYLGLWGPCTIYAYKLVSQHIWFYIFSLTRNRKMEAEYYSDEIYIFSLTRTPYLDTSAMRPWQPCTETAVPLCTDTLVF